MSELHAFDIRLATLDDVTELARLIDGSVRELQHADYTATEIELALATVYGVDTTLIADGTYYAIAADAELVACGGWSRRATLYGGDGFHGRSEALLDPRSDAAKIRAFFVAPAYARCGLATRLLAACERAAAAAGFTCAELGATRTGVPFYLARGYAIVGDVDVALPQGERLAVIRMTRTLARAGCSS
jgi:GNAT superfamily N-acetyltransferase